MEKDYLLLLDFDDTVESFEVQAVHIPVKGVPRGYVPDILVRYRPDPETGECQRPLLAEVKRSDFLKKHAVKYAPKFAAAMLFAENQGWEFRTVDESEIRVARLKNIKFLREYRNVNLSEDDCDQVVRVIELQGGNSSSERVLSVLAPTDDARLHWLPVIWAMVQQKKLLTDLDIPFASDVALRSNGSVS